MIPTLTLDRGGCSSLSFYIASPLGGRFWPDPKILQSFVVRTLQYCKLCAH
jgi:hypothetical protein